MIPLRLKISGFLSYRDPAEVDFSTFELACISGANGAGKSSLLDAITWALFGKARKQDDSLINAQSNAAEVSLIFAYEGNIYRVQRTKVRDKTGVLEFQIFLPSSGSSVSNPAGIDLSAGSWKPLTEHSLTGTNLRIQQTLRLDYDTFINASFFLQGKADQFTQQRPSDRKRILGSILGLEIWETYRQNAASQRRQVEDEISVIDGQLREIQAELSEESLRKHRLKQLEDDLARLSTERANQEAVLESIRRLTATLAEQQKLTDSLQNHLQESSLQLDEQKQRLAQRQAERVAFIELEQRAAEIEALHQSWQENRRELEQLEQLANQFREQENLRAAPLAEIQSARAALEKETQLLRLQQAEYIHRQQEQQKLQPELEAAHQRQISLELQQDQRREIEANLVMLREQWLELKNATQSLEDKIVELHERRDQLDHVEEATCPLCGQPLNVEDRVGLISSFTEEEAQAIQAVKTNQEKMKAINQQGEELKKRTSDSRAIERELQAASQASARLASNLEMLENQQREWESKGALRLVEITRILNEDGYAADARAHLAQIDSELRQIGYDPQRHEQIRKAEQIGRVAEEELRALELARAARAPLEREIAELDKQIGILNEQVARQQIEAQQAAQALETARSQVPDLPAAESAFNDLQEKENTLRRETGAAHQLVAVLADLKKRRKSLEGSRQELAHRTGLYKQLERAFGKDGVPALLIEQALPQIETRANEILDRLSNGSMSVRFNTQAAYKDKSRQDLKETLDIQISDGAGMRDYEMFSGGEAFRVNFAIRLALSEVLAQRAGARLQTLVIDEGFGSQDTRGRQRLIEAINLVRPDFAKILVITHIDELKDSFPNRIEVEKTERGSTVKIV